MKQMRILVTGKNGQVGRELQRSLEPLGEVIAVDRQVMDLAYPESIRAVVRGIRPDIIVNAAAYTLVDKAESHHEEAHTVNATAVAVLAEEAKKQGALLIHYSTDYVFDGMKGSPYIETDRCIPLNVYGHSKREGEESAAAVGGTYLILRTSWVYGMHGNNFLLTMLRLGKEKSELRIVNDQIGAPTSSRLLADKTAELVQWHQCHRMSENQSGIYHLTAAGQTSWYGFASAIFDEVHKRYPGQPVPHLIPITSAEYPTPAIRPKFSCLSREKIEKQFGVCVPEWRHCLQDLLI